ncbi:hypothetical protein SAJA_10180 [Salinisphaera japonica YTM-1]|uniref:Uncharacterized protein n=1 Tax=Salinisphaera japonica YTM-1 TaxID=1209778 RepID=A0A423PN88_9GAMM|nr:hypothetical protein SAJA_10180 [Salinisphaera japonica YTM-1]
MSRGVHCDAPGDCDAAFIDPLQAFDAAVLSGARIPADA